MPIYLKDILPIENLGDYKIHFARYNQHSQPLDVWIRDKAGWKEWQEYRPEKRNEFNRPYIFSLMQFYHEHETWLFGGVFEVLKRYEDRYEVNQIKIGEEYIGRLKIRHQYTDRLARVRMEAHYEKFEVKEILPEPYTGRSFPGFEEIDIPFEELESIIRVDRADWKTALENLKGIYLLTFTEGNTYKRYIGSAYGEDGIWSRWRSYIATLSGGNKGIKEMITELNLTKDFDSEKLLEHFRKNCRFTLLEHRFADTSDDKILERESHWKDILRTREKEAGGLNRN